MVKDVNIFFDELEVVNSFCKDDDFFFYFGNLISILDDVSRLEVGGEVRVCDFLKMRFLI